nr:RHS repeat-associated core domain-containing protein [Pseudomonas extremorientalis]
MAKVVSHESYHPYGTTALRKRGDSSEKSYRTLGYSGKEKDATGLYYYGFRYYMPALQRWINPDPAQAIDGLNLYRMVRNNPILLRDNDGLAPTNKADEELAPSGPAPSLLKRLLPAWWKNTATSSSPPEESTGDTSNVYLHVPENGGVPTVNVLVNRRTFEDGSHRITYVGANPDGSEEQESAVNGYLDYVVRGGLGERVVDIHTFVAKPEGKGYGSLLLLELADDAEKQSIQRIAASSVAKNATGFYLLAGFHPSRGGHDILEEVIPGPIDFGVNAFSDVSGEDGLTPLERFGHKWQMARNSSANWEGEAAFIKEQAKLSTMKRRYFKRL